MAAKRSRVLLQMTVLYAVLVTCASQKDVCPAKSNQCNCEFDGESADGGQAESETMSTKSEAMAAAVGAISPVLLAGTGFAVWKMVKGNSSQDSSEFRSMSEMSDTSLDQKSSSQSNDSYYSRRGSTALSLMDTEDELLFDEDSPRGGPNINQGDHPSSSWGKSGQTGTKEFYTAAKNDDLNSWMN